MATRARSVANFIALALSVVWLSVAADFAGYVGHKPDQTNGGTSVIASGTLGRQEPPGSIYDYSEVARQGDHVTNAILLAMSQAESLKTAAIDSTESFMSRTADNVGLLTLMKFNSRPPFNDPVCSPLPAGNCTIPRAMNAPWFLGTAPNKPGTYVSSIRVDSLLYVANPGESFAQVNEAIRDGMLDANAVNVVGLAGDFLGYHRVRGQYTLVEVGSSNVNTYNLGPDFAHQTASATRDISPLLSQ